MRCMLEDRELDRDAWPSILQEASYEINSMHCASTGYSLSLQNYAWNRTMTTCYYSLWLQNKPTHVSIEDWCEETRNRLIETIRNARINLNEAQERMKEGYDVGKATADVDTDDLVLLKNQPRTSGLDPCYVDPYQVIHRKGVNVELQVDEKRKLVHLNRCKVFKQPEQELWI